MLYKFLVGALLLFPWVLAGYIALGSFRAAWKKILCARLKREEP